MLRGLKQKYIYLFSDSNARTIIHILVLAAIWIPFTFFVPPINLENCLLFPSHHRLSSVYTRSKSSSIGGSPNVWPNHTYIPSTCTLPISIITHFHPISQADFFLLLLNHFLLINAPESIGNLLIPKTSDFMRVSTYFVCLSTHRYSSFNTRRRTHTHVHIYTTQGVCKGRNFSCTPNGIKFALSALSSNLLCLSYFNLDTNNKIIPRTVFRGIYSCLKLLRTPFGNLFICITFWQI